MKDNTVLIYAVALIGITLLSYILWNIDYSEQSIEEPVIANEFFCGTTSIYPSSDSDLEKEGKYLFKANCAACHKIYKRSMGPALLGSMKKFSSDSIFLSYIRGQKISDSLVHNSSIGINSFPQMSYKEASALRAYINIH